MIKQKENKGITLVALIITVIILLILAGVTISLVIGENGLITKSKQSTEKYKEKEKIEKAQLEELETGMVELSADKEVMKILVDTGEDGAVGLPIRDYESNLEVNWGDGTQNSEIPHIYVEKNKEYEIQIKGKVSSIISYEEGITEEKIIKILQWGETDVKNIDLRYCTNLKEIVAPTKEGFKEVENISFRECKNLLNIPSNLFASSPKITEFGDTFSYCTSLKSIPSNLFENCSNVTEFCMTFSGCENLTSIPSNLFANCKNVKSFDRTFSYCTSLKSIPSDLFDNCSNVTSFESTFYSCTALKGDPIKLWAEGRKGIDENNGGYHCYYNCTGLNDYDKIPDIWKQEQGKPI